MKIIVTDYSGWEKTSEQEKAVVRVGSAPESDIELPSTDIAPTHLQLHYLPEEFGCKVLNVGSGLTVMREGSPELLQSYAHCTLGNDDEILLGGYRIRVQLPFTTKLLQKSPAIGASLSFPDTTLYPHAPSAGWLTVKNMGERSPSQFHVSVSGLPNECVQVDPIPLLYAGAQEEVRIQLLHRGLYPEAGETVLNIRVFAPGDYPGEQVLIEQGIYVTPVFAQRLEFLDDDTPEIAFPRSAPEPSLVAQPDISSVPDPVPLSQPSPKPIPAPEPVRATQEAELEPVFASASAPSSEPEPVEMGQAKPTPKPVVVRDLPDEFWDEGA